MTILTSESDEEDDLHSQPKKEKTRVVVVVVAGDYDERVEELFDRQEADDDDVGLTLT